MRLTEYQINAIIENTKSIFGKNSKVYLFGSRTDDKKRGGDIDLLIECDEYHNNFSNELTFLSLLKRSIGQQKIDTIIKTTDVEDNRVIVSQALETGILLNYTKVNSNL